MGVTRFHGNLDFVQTARLFRVANCTAAIAPQLSLSGSLPLAWPELLARVARMFKTTRNQRSLNRGGTRHPRRGGLETGNVDSDCPIAVADVQFNSTVRCELGKIAEDNGREVHAGNRFGLVSR